MCSRFHIGSNAKAMTALLAARAVERGLLTWDTPAAESGLQKGDVVVEVNGERVTDGIALIVAIRSHQPGETLEFTVERDGRERTIKVTLDSEVG